MAKRKRGRPLVPTKCGWCSKPHKGITERNAHERTCPKRPNGSGK